MQKKPTQPPKNFSTIDAHLNLSCTHSTSKIISNSTSKSASAFASTSAPASASTSACKSTVTCASESTSTSIYTSTLAFESASLHNFIPTHINAVTTDKKARRKV